jgi:hypothetical protein
VALTTRQRIWIAQRREAETATRSFWSNKSTAATGATAKRSHGDGWIAPEWMSVRLSVRLFADSELCFWPLFFLGSTDR